MWHTQFWILFLAIILFASTLHASKAPKSSVFLSPPFFQQPGLVANKWYFGIPFPEGHIALKSFQAEVVDVMGVPVPLHETYLHHWVVERYYGVKGAIIPSMVSAREFSLSKVMLARNAGVCKGTLGQYFGLGSETRRTDTWVPDPYGIEVGNSAEIPDGYEEKWLLNLHAIDTRGVDDRLGCTECKCSLLNVTQNEHGKPLRKDYTGGLYCCYDQTKCRVREGFEGLERKLFLRYTVEWVDWDDKIVPVKIYIFDVTDSSGLSTGSTDENAELSCKVEYEVKACSVEGRHNGDCVDTKRTRVALPKGGDIVYGVAHQHSGGVGSALYGQDGRVLCTSIPIYGQGKEAGDEAGYIVGMSTCYPKPGSVRVADGEVLTLVSNYSSTLRHTGVMGLFYVLVAEPQESSNWPLFDRLQVSWVKELQEYSWAFVLTGGVLAVVAGVFYLRRNSAAADGYQSLVIT